MVCYFLWRFFGTLKCEAERRPRSVGVALEFRFCEARCTFHHLISRILVQWRMELLRSVHISDPVYRVYGGFSKIFRHFQASQWVEWSSRLPRVPMCTHVGGPQAHDRYSNRRPSRCAKQDRLTKRCQWTLESRIARCFIQRAKERTHYMKIGVVFSCHQLIGFHWIQLPCWSIWKFSLPSSCWGPVDSLESLLSEAHDLQRKTGWLLQVKEGTHMITYAGRSRFGLGILVDMFLIVFVQSFSTQEHCPFVAAFFSSSSPLSQTPELVARKIHDFQWPCCTIFYPVVMSCHDNSGWLDDIGRISTRVYVYVFVYQVLLQRSWLSIVTGCAHLRLSQSKDSRCLSQLSDTCFAKRWGARQNSTLMPHSCPIQHYEIRNPTLWQIVLVVGYGVYEWVGVLPHLVMMIFFHFAF